MKRAFIIVIGIAALFLAGVEFLYHPPVDKFPARTVVNGTDVSGLSIKEAEKKVSAGISSRNFEFSYKGEVYTVPLDSLTFDLTLGSLLESPDLGITEAAVGAGIDSLLLFATLKKIHAIRNEGRGRQEGSDERFCGSGACH